MANLFNQLFNPIPNQNHNADLLQNALSLAQLDPNFSSQQLNHFNPLFQSLPPSVLSKRPNQYELPNAPEKKSKLNPNNPGLPSSGGFPFNLPSGYDSLFPFGGMPGQRGPQRNEQDLMAAGGFLPEALIRGRPEMDLYSQLGLPQLGGGGFPGGQKLGNNQELANAMLLRPELYSLLEGNPAFNGGLFNSQNPFAQLKEPQVQSYNPAMLLNMQNQANLLSDQQRNLNPFLNLPKMPESVNPLNNPNLSQFDDMKQLQQALRTLQQREARPEFPPGINPHALLQQNLTLQDPSMLSLQFLQGEQGLPRELLERQFQSQNQQDKLQQQLNNFNLLQQQQANPSFNPAKPESYFQNPQLLQQMQAANMQGFDPQDMNSLLKQYNKNALQHATNPHEGLANTKRHNILTNINAEALPQNLSIPKKKPEEMMRQPMQLVDLKPTVQIQEEIHPKRSAKEDLREAKNISDAGSYDREPISPSGYEYASTVSTNEVKKKSEDDSYFPDEDLRGGKKAAAMAAAKKKQQQARQNEAIYSQVVAPQKLQERRKNRWQMAQEEKIKEDEITKTEAQQVYVQKIVNTTLGPNHQVQIPDLMLNDYEPIERHPRLKWAPNSIEENDWTDLIEKVEACLRQTVNEEKLIKMLHENENSIPKVLEVIQRDPRKYSQAFAVKLRRPKLMP